MKAILAILLGLAVLLGIAQYMVKDEHTRKERRLAAIGQEIAERREGIRVLRAEWAYLTRPERIEELSANGLGLAPTAHTQIQPPDGLPKLPGPPALPQSRPPRLTPAALDVSG